jgi:quercetin dioxygenase-like cupin family protein
MATLVGFGTFAALAEELISEKISRRILSGDQGMLVWWSIAAGVHVEPHSHANEQIVWMLKGKMEFRLGSEQRTPRSTMPSSIGIGVSQSIRIPSRASLFAGFNL